MNPMDGSHERFLTYYHDHKDKVFNYLMVRLNFDRGAAEDLLMDIILKAYEHFDSFNPQKGSFKTWIFTLAHNHLVNFWRDTRKKKTVSIEQLEEEGVFVGAVEAKNDLVRQIENKKIHHILSFMNDNEREIISLRYFEDLDYSEMAEILHKKEGAVRTGLSRAVKRFSDTYRKIYSKK